MIHLNAFAQQPIVHHPFCCISNWDTRITTWKLMMIVILVLKSGNILISGYVIVSNLLGHSQQPSKTYRSHNKKDAFDGFSDPPDISFSLQPGFFSFQPLGLCKETPSPGSHRSGRFLSLAAHPDGLCHTQLLDGFHFRDEILRPKSRRFWSQLVDQDESVCWATKI